ncbi:replication initiator protein A [Streptococcus porcinus]|uniref:IFN-response binding factor 1 n=1 Tax=Streptococcus porcinus TaxID=1340 RepID=A0A4V0H6I0_STRPO|nr:replication initiator protein A [Streptococcus porcinus]SQG44682.1 IFN-response binding factor 1 [Streptococcus porcinus]VTS34781.1 IFN-response binding factor 1 [Streptococcus porcinus]VTT44834.1 IFN-response binding factor 1 [Streptococcus porcinus]VTT46269.1 IFN-response binding factor 1 [Streptococcus porcinus]
MAYGRISLEQALNCDNFHQLLKVIIGTKYYSKLKVEAKLLFMLLKT